MAEFLVKMADERGRVLEQTESASSESDLRERFSKQGFYVYSVRSKGLFSDGLLGAPRRKKVKQGDFLVFNQQFFTLIHAGLPIPTALELLAKRQRNAFFRSVLENVRERVKSGEVLSSAFAAQGIFPQLYNTTLVAGEKSGALEEVLTRYISFQRVAMSVRKKLLVSLIYPALLIGLVTIMITYLIAFVVPKFADLYRDLQAPLPSTTLYLIAFGQTVHHYFPFIVLGLAIVLLIAWKWKNSQSGAETLDQIRLKLPVLGGIWLKYQIAMFSRMMGTLLAGGLPLVPALETAGASIQSRSVARASLAAAERVREGISLSTSLEETAMFPDLALEMLEVGESTGSMREMLNSVAEFYEEDVENATAAAMSLIEPALLIFVAIFIGFVLISLYMPIFSIGSAMGTQH
jgi:type IV pilus assembly protein PilC